MEDIKNKLRNAQLMINEAVECLEKNTLDSLIRTIELQKTIGISFYNNEIQTRIVELVNEELLKDTFFKASLQSAQNNSYEILIFAKGYPQTIAHVNLSRKEFYHFINLDANLSCKYQLINNLNEQLIDVNKNIESIVKLKNKGIFVKYKDNSNSLKLLTNKKIQIEESIKTEKEALIKLEKLNASLESEILRLISSFQKIGFNINYFEHKLIKEYKIFKKPAENYGFSNSYYDNNNSVKLGVLVSKGNYSDANIKDMSSNHELKLINLNQNTMEKIYEYIKDNHKFENLSFEKVLKSDSDYTKVSFSQNQINYILTNTCDIIIEGKGGNMYSLVKLNLIADIMDIIYSLTLQDTSKEEQ